jgi:hypothetical protein
MVVAEREKMGEEDRLSLAPVVFSRTCFVQERDALASAGFLLTGAKRTSPQYFRMAL